jgi:hypothetical protein
MNISKIATILAAIIATVMIVAFFIDIPALQAANDVFAEWGVVVSAFALGLGAINLFRRQVESVAMRHKKEDNSWIYNALCLVVFLVSGTIGIIKGPGAPAYDWIFQAIVETGHAAVSALVIFNIATAAFRAFRVHNIDSFLMLAAGIILILGQAPIGSVIWSRLPDVSEWMMDVVNLAGQRAIIISAALATVITGLRIIVGVERPPFRQVKT